MNERAAKERAHARLLLERAWLAADHRERGKLRRVMLRSCR